MAKFEEVTNFNIDDSNYTVESLHQEAKDLLRVYLELEDDIFKSKMTLVKQQHSLNSVGNMFREMLKDVKPAGPVALMVPGADPGANQASTEVVEVTTDVKPTKKIKSAK